MQILNEEYEALLRRVHRIGRHRRYPQMGREGHIRGPRSKTHSMIAQRDGCLQPLPQGLHWGLAW